MMKIVALVYRKKGISQKQFRSYWVDRHGPFLVTTVPDLLHYTQNVPVESPGEEDDADGIAELWFEDMDALQDYLEWRETESAQELRRDENSFQDVTRMRRYIVEEHAFKRQRTSTVPG